MKFENFSPGKPAESEKEEINKGRRKFLKTLGKSALVGTALAVGIEGCSPRKEKEKEKPEPVKKESKIPEKVFVDKTQDDEGYIEDDDVKTARESIDFKSKEEIIIDRSVSEKTRAEWERKYSEERRYVESLDFAIREIEKYLPEFRKIFREEGVPEELLFLAIPESHCKIKALSEKNAKGFFQFTKDTGRKFGLVITEKIDERLNPIKSAKACAKYLKYLRNSCKGKNDDWSLELSGYNGGYIWEYLKECHKTKKEPNYDGFLRYITNGINDVKKETKNNKFVVHKVSDGETLKKIAEIYKTTEEEIRRFNNLAKKFSKNPKNRKKTKDNIITLEKGQKIRIPLVDSKKRSLPKVREAAFKYKTAGYLENLVYPPKYIAVLKLVKKYRPDWFEK